MSVVLSLVAGLGTGATAIAQRRPPAPSRGDAARPSSVGSPLGRSAPLRADAGRSRVPVRATVLVAAGASEPPSASVPTPEELQSAIAQTQQSLRSQFGARVLVLTGHSTPTERRELARGLVALRSVIAALRHPWIATRPEAFHLIHLGHEGMQTQGGPVTEEVTLDLRADPRSWGELLSTEPGDEPVVQEFRSEVAARDRARPAVMGRVERALRDATRSARPADERLRAEGVRVGAVSDRAIAPGLTETTLQVDDPDVDEVVITHTDATGAIGVQMRRAGRDVRTLGLQADGTVRGRATPHYDGNLRAYVVTEDRFGNERRTRVENPRVVPRTEIARQRLVPEDVLFERLAARLGRSEPALVGVVDSGVDYNHPAIAHSLETGGNDAPLERGGVPALDNPVGWDFVDDDPRPYDPPPAAFSLGGHVNAPYHGTSVTAVAVQGTGRVRAVVCRAGDECSIARALEYLRARGVRTVNLSQGSRDPMPRVTAEIARSPDTLHVMGAGNDHGADYDHAPFHPQQEEHPNAIVVGAHDSRGAIADLSTSDSRRVHVVAPGVSVPVALPDGESELASGTSFAAPFVANLAAKIRVLAPHLSSAGVREIILRTADRVPAILRGTSHGRVNPVRALHLAYLLARAHDSVPIRAALREIRDTHRAIRAEPAPAP